MNDTPETIPLPAIPAELKRQFGISPGYRAIYNAALDASLPAEQRRGRWYVARADLPRVAERFGLSPIAA